MIYRRLAIHGGYTKTMRVTNRVAHGREHDGTARPVSGGVAPKASQYERLQHRLKKRYWKPALLGGCSLVFIAGVLSGCSASPTRLAVPPDLIAEAEVLGLPGVRFYGDAPSASLQADLVRSIRDENPEWFPRGPNDAYRYAVLALSGGGDHGAFGVGFLQGWSDSGQRPRFKVVTGVSTGALIAPFALLGPDYDYVIRQAYTTVTAKDIFRRNSLLRTYFGDAMADNHPLQRLVHEAVTDDVIDRIADAYRHGQRLFIGTTNLDAQRPVIWNMGAIAASGKAGSKELFRDVLLASAAIPILFPPVMIDVEVGKQRYDEMHVDGGTVGQMFFYGATVDWREVLREASGLPEPTDDSVYYAIVDGDIDPEPQSVRVRLGSISKRTISTMVKVSAWSSLYRMYLHAEQRGYEFKYVSLPSTYRAEVAEPYDPGEMRRMFEIGFERGQSNGAWRVLPPGY